MNALPGPLAVEDEHSLDIYFPDGRAFTMSKTDYASIMMLFSSQSLMSPVVLQPTSIINYLEESNPRLLEAEVQIEKDKLRRKLTSPLGEYSRFLIPFVMLIIAGAIAYNMFKSGATDGAANVMQNAASSAPIVLK